MAERGAATSRWSTAPGGQLLPAPSAWAGVAPGYLAHLLRGVLTGPGADAEPVAARLAAELLVALAEAGVGAEGAWALATRPGTPSTYLVRSFVSGSLDPVDPLETDDPGEAVLGARDRAGDLGRRVELVSLDAAGLQRCVLTQSTAGLRYRFPELACLEAPGVGGGTLVVAIEAWRAALQPTAPPAASSSPSAGPAADAVAEAVLALLVQDGRALRTYDVADVLASLIPTPADVADLVVARLVDHFEGRGPAVAADD